MNLEKQKLLFPFFLVCYEMCIYLSDDMYVPSLPDIMRDLNASYELVQATLSIWFLGSGSLQLFLGPVSDSFGRRTVLLTGGVIFILSTIACALATNIEGMLVARFIQGTSVGSMIVAGYAIIHELYSSTRAIQILAFMGSVVVLAPAMGPVVGALVLSVTTWRSIFWLLTVIGIITLIGLSKVMPETKSKKIPINIREILSDYKGLFFSRYFMSFSIIFGFILSSLFVWLITSPFIIAENYNSNPSYFAVVQLFVCGSLVVGNYITKYSIAKYKVKHIVMVGLLLALSGAIFFASISYWSNNIRLITASMMLVTLGISIIFAPLSRLAIDFSTHPMGRRTAMNSAIISSMGAFSTFLVTLFKIRTFVGVSLLILAILSCAVLIYFSLDRTKFPSYEKS